MTGAATVASRAPDDWRPRFHVTGERNWINDPNGPIQHAGVYHLFHQANPERPFWGRPAWGHVTSTDLVTWTRRRPALVPEQGGPDADGCWSGCTRIVDGRPAIYYTGVVGEDEARVESVCRAWGSEDLLSWERDAGNPLVAGPWLQLGSGYHRDPFLWRDGDGWHLLLGSGTTTGERHGQVLRYDSPDATDWTYGGVFFARPRSMGALDLGEHWECPQLLLEGDRAALILSCQVPGAEQPLMHCVAFVGRVREGRFEGELAGRIDHGDVFYAPAIFRDESGRDLMVGWAQEHLDAERHATLSHAGALTLPRELALQDGALRTRPVPEIQGLRREALDAQGAFAIPPQVELAATMAGGGGRAGWRLLAGGGEPRASVEVDLDRRELAVAVDDGAGDPRSFAAPLAGDGPHELRVLLDGSLLEAFAGDACAITTRVYARSGVCTAAHAQSSGDARLHGSRAWRLASDAIADH
ncbi:MAG: beta-fructofuranosidase [Solirubrobacteraceae bacterium]|nr:beta-fructofuranosidase [Solirubrobacteraceae bacterium]